MRGLSTRNYGAVVKDFQTAYGIEKSAVSENFIEASREKVKQLMERPLGELQLCAVLIDGTPFKDRQMIVALGIGCDGRKTVLGIREGATENTAVVSSLLSELVERGLDFSVAAAVYPGRRQSAARGRATPRRRGGVHPALPGPQETQCRRSLAGRTQSRRQKETAERLCDGGLRRRQAALDRLHRELMDLNPSAARSLEEGMEETLTVHKLRVPDQLRRTLSCTNVIESAFSIVETVCRNVKRWRDGRSDRAVGWLRIARRRAAVPQGDRPSPDSLAAVLYGQRRF